MEFSKLNWATISETSRPLGHCSFRISWQIPWFQKFHFYDVTLWHPKRESAQKGLNTTSGAQFAALPLVKPAVWFARAVVNWRWRSVAKSAYWWTITTFLRYSEQQQFAFCPLQLHETKYFILMLSQQECKNLRSKRGCRQVVCNKARFYLGYLRDRSFPPKMPSFPPKNIVIITVYK